MIVCGVDASSNKSGVSILQDGEIVGYTLIDLHRIRDINQRIPTMINEICKYINQFKPDKILMEENQGSYAQHLLFLSSFEIRLSIMLFLQPLLQNH